MKNLDKQKLLLFLFIFIFSFFIIYFILGKLFHSTTVIEGITSNQNTDKTKKENSSETAEDKEVKSMIKNMNNFLSKNVEPKINKLLEEANKLSNDSNKNMLSNAEDDANKLSNKNKSLKKSVNQNETPFTDNEIRNIV